MVTKTVCLEIKELDEKGSFTGLASVYGNRDLGGDVIHHGAFTQTITHNKGRFPLFYRHRVNVGVSRVEDKDEGLLTKGLLNLEVGAARDVHSNLKFYKEHGQPFGMSIGYHAVPAGTEFRADTRHLREVVLFENTLTELPMNQEALVNDVKEFDLAEIMRALKEGDLPPAQIKSAIELLQARLAESSKERGTPSGDGGADSEGDAATTAGTENLHLALLLLRTARQ